VPAGATLVQTSDRPLTCGANFDRVTLSAFTGTWIKTKGTVQGSRYRERPHDGPCTRSHSKSPTVIQIFGSIGVIFCVIGGFVLEGGHIMALWHPFEILIIIGSALGAFFTSNPTKLIKASFSGALATLKGPRYSREDYVQLLKLLYDALMKIRKDGLMAIEADLEAKDGGALFKKYPKIAADKHLVEFITDCLRLMVGGSLDPHELESLLEMELEAHHEAAHEPAHAVQSVADALPGFGIVAAVLGIVNTMATLDGADTAMIGHKVGAALVGTFLGILVSYGFIGPIAIAMGHAANEEGRAFEVVKMALVASVRGYVPSIAIEFARKILMSDVRPSFGDLEAQLKAKPRAAA
jgi:chemotaxis protein MotA